MFKNILKSLAWVALYFVLTTIAVVIVSGVAVGVQLAEQPELLEASTEEITEMTMEAMTAYSIYGLGVAGFVMLGIFALYKVIRKHPFDIKRINLSHCLMATGFGLLLNAVLTPIVSVLATLLPESWMTALTESTDMAIGGNNFVLTVLAAGILVPIMEEIIFRYGVFKTLSRSNVVVGFVVSSIVFGLMHGNIIQFAYTMLLGLFFAFIYLKTDNIWVPACCHMAINTSSSLSVLCPVEYSWWYFAGVGALGLAILIPIFIKKEDVRQMFQKQLKKE